MSRALRWLVSSPAGIRAVRARQSAGWRGRLEVQVTPPLTLGGLVPLADAFGPLWFSSADAPFLLHSLEVLNPTPSGIDLWLALRDGTGSISGSGMAFAAWLTPVAAGSAWRWEGELAMHGQVLYGRGSVAGLVLCIQGLRLEPG